MSDIYHSPLCSALIQTALAEDLDGADDMTIAALVPAGARLRAEMTAKAAGVLCGMPLFARVCDQIESGVQVSLLYQDGAAVESGTVVLTAEGSARTLLIAERTALNLMQRLSGTATMTRRYVDAVVPHPAQILDTRKTTPGLRQLQKYAVLMGGGKNHRIGLYDQVLIKENHIALMQQGSPAEAVTQCRQRYPDGIIEVEIEQLQDLDAVIRAGANIVLLDNMAPGLLAEAVAIRANRPVELEASGGITLETITAVAASGVDRISVGALTHSVAAFDLSLRCYPV